MLKDFLKGICPDFVLWHYHKYQRIYLEKDMRARIEANEKRGGVHFR